MVERKTCFLCGCICFTERHHIFGGANRKLSEEDGLVVDLCHACHNEPPNGVHYSKMRMDELHQYGQIRYEQRLMNEGKTAEEARTAFMQRYGRNYL